MMSQQPLPLAAKKELRRVTFREERLETPVVSFAFLDDDVRCQLWYSPTELHHFLEHARFLSDAVRSYPNLMQDECIRGLEFRSSVSRRERRMVITKSLVKAQRRCSDSTQLANIAYMCSSWSRMAACAEAKKDFYAAFDIALTCDIPDMADFPLPLRSVKRRVVEDHTTVRTRNVRRRTVAIMT